MTNRRAGERSAAEARAGRQGRAAAGVSVVGADRRRSWSIPAPVRRTAGHCAAIDTNAPARRRRSRPGCRGGHQTGRPARHCRASLFARVAGPARTPRQPPRAWISRGSWVRGRRGRRDACCRLDRRRGPGRGLHDVGFGNTPPGDLGVCHRVAAGPPRESTAFGVVGEDVMDDAPLLRGAGSLGVGCTRELDERLP